MGSRRLHPDRDPEPRGGLEQFDKEKLAVHWSR